MTRLYMNIVATTKRLLAVSTNVGSEMALIGRLIGRKTYVTIETIRTVFHLQVGYFVIETGIVRNGLPDAFLEIRLGCQILCLVFLEPLTVVVSSHILQKMIDLLDIHLICIAIVYCFSDVWDNAR